ncbi:hypothetical protein EYF80_008767 [Liparis tanakae]|uniref:Uncharacterized protein n=1 Tax=Liparis tanakae TaxID=230148 RepID=A0A4Z2ITG2_9TELE|nr:hypothetical protein EYF80_008767 [Liparis tanakae]
MPYGQAPKEEHDKSLGDVIELHSQNKESERQIWAFSKPSPLIGRELILVESPQEGAETCHFLLKLRARDWLGEVKAWSFIWQDKRRMIQEALKDV